MIEVVGSRAADDNNNNNNNNNNANICIAQLKQNSSGALMAQTNTVSVFGKLTFIHWILWRSYSAPSRPEQLA